jgi:hypothetical protein
MLRQAATVITRHDLETTLAALLPKLSEARHPWWILGSAAVVLHGGDPDEIWDVDVLLDQRDVTAVFAALGLTPQPGKPDGKFRSEVFHRWNLASLPVELFAGFCLFEQGGWHELVLQTRVAVAVGGGVAYVPDRDELIAILRRFGRPKDQMRIAALSRISLSPSRSESA